MEHDLSLIFVTVTERWHAYLGLAHTDEKQRKQETNYTHVVVETRERKDDSEGLQSCPWSFQASLLACIRIFMHILVSHVKKAGLRGIHRDGDLNLGL